MSKIQYFVAGPSEDYSLYYGPDFFIGEHSGSSVSLLDGNGGMVTLKGKGFAFSADYEMVRGTVTSVIFGNEEGAIFARSTGHNFKIAEAAGASGTKDLTIDELTWAMSRENDLMLGSNDAEILQGFRGNDTIKAGGGNDTIYGDQGNDRITGGSGSDTFVVAGWDGHTVITDFDANGGGALQDYMVSYDDSFTEKQKGKDLLLIFDADTRVTLLGVSKNDFDSADIL